MFSLQLGKNISPVKQMFFPNWEIIQRSVCVFRAKLTRNKSGQLENRKRQPDYKKSGCLLIMSGSVLLLGYSFEPLHHGEHDSHGDKANNQENSPAVTDGDRIVHKRAYPQQEVADSRST